MEDMKKEKKENRFLKYALQFILFLFLIWLTFHILLKEQNMEELFILLRNAKIEFIMIGFLCMMAYFFFDSLNLRRTLIALEEKCSLKDAIRYTLLGFFFSSITPAASGGQPMQIYVMHKDGIRVSSSTLALVLNLFSFQCVTIGLELISVVYLHEYMDARNYLAIYRRNIIKLICSCTFNHRHFFS